MFSPEMKKRIAEALGGGFCYKCGRPSERMRKMSGKLIYCCHEHFLTRRQTEKLHNTVTVRECKTVMSGNLSYLLES